MANEDKNNNKKILVIEAVEDDLSLRSVLRTKFTNEGFRVLEAGDGEEGLIVALRERPDLIVLDILMPRMDGIAMMQKLRKTNEWGKAVPIVLLTNLSADDERINKAITENEPAYYLVKSNYTISDLVEKIKERLSR
jgi:DNA-binding response OmpR family regulator